MPIGPKGPPQKPGLSLRGRLIFDTFSGIPRVRPWPPSKPTKPGSKRQFTARAFGAANRACKITEATWYGDNWQATRGTPLLPRDLMIAFMYGRAVALKLEDGRIIRSMAARNDVSESLDLITNTEGRYLVRGPKYWQEAPAPTPEPWKLQEDHTITSTVPFYVIALDPSWNQVNISCFDLTCAVASFRALQVSTDGGATWWNGANDYRFVRPDGTHGFVPDITGIDAASSSPRSCSFMLHYPTRLGPMKLNTVENRQSYPHYLVTTDAPFTHVRIINRNLSQLTGGRIITWSN